MTSPIILSRDETAASDEPAYSLAPDTAVVLMGDGSARVLDMADRFYAVPAVGARMLRETLGHGPAVAAERVAEAYGAALPRVEADLQGFLQTLEQRGVLHRRGRSGRRRGMSSFSAAVAVVLLKILLRLLPSRKSRAAALLSAARLSLGLFGWAPTLSAWRRHFPPRPRPTAPQEREAAIRAIDDAVCGAAAGNPLGVVCKERGLCCWALARTAGLPADLVIGVELYPLAGHCWCEVEGHVLSDHPDNCARYTPALRYQ